MAAAQESALQYIIATVEVDPSTLEMLDTQNSSREKDGVTIRMASPAIAVPIQLWEVYVAAAVLLMQPHSDMVFLHVKALCEHSAEHLLCEAVLKEHTSIGAVIDSGQSASFQGFFDEYLQRKFKIQFAKQSLQKYLLSVLDDPMCGKNDVPRVFLVSRFLQAFLLNASFFDGQYDELIEAMRMHKLPINDVLVDGEQEIGEAVDIVWDNLKMYADPNMILKEHGGWSVTKTARMLTPKDQLVMRLTGCTLEQLLAGTGVPDSPRQGEDPRASASKQAELKRRTHGPKGRESRMLRHAGLGARKDDENDNNEDSDSSHASDFEVDPEHAKIVPLGITVCEMYLLLRGVLIGQEAFSGDWRGNVVGEQVTRLRRDKHILAAAVLVDLYMREQIDVHHWTLGEGNVAVPYQLRRRLGMGKMGHFLDEYVPHIEDIFRDMRLPLGLAEGPIWASLEDRGVVDNHRPSWQRAYGCGYTRVDVWDLVRPDLLLDLSEGYLLAALLLYDKHFAQPLDGDSNDVLMFCYIVQHLFDVSFEARDGMARVLRKQCPPFEKGTLFPPVAMVHSGAVCLGLIDRGLRIAQGHSTQLAMEAAEFNQAVMERLERKFFLSPKIWESFDEDQSGELSLEEFVEGMRNVDVYKEFRRERVPDDVLRMILSDLAERLFREVDINMDGTLTPQEIGLAFTRRREKAQKQQQEQQWFRQMLRSSAKQLGVLNEKPVDEVRAAAVKLKNTEKQAAQMKEGRRLHEWASEVERVELLDENVDVDTSQVTYRV